ncbi:prokineticin-1-like isoform X2 [Polyodon spathula]|uniref:prokineticin-1-like isoform X2 n=1 Tax=Polyodon spathula TaxID=7913 RepID=UPI001B7DB1E1|nr:prokineticin-1-like isoform X2 [Polyodon spathula]
MRKLLVFCVLVSVYVARTAVITGVCEEDAQCSRGWCCAGSLWIRGLQLCTPFGQHGDECRPYFPKMLCLRKWHYNPVCPCLPKHTCMRWKEGTYRCTEDAKRMKSSFRRM